MEEPITSPGLPTPGEIPALPWEKPAKPPWKPRASGVAAFLCGPLAGALIAHINLRRMGEKRKGVLILILTAIGSGALILMLLRLTDTGSTLLGKFVSYFISPFLFPMLQRKEFEKWKAAHPKSEPAGGWGATGWALLGAAGFLAILVVMANLPVLSEVRDADASVYAPKNAVEGEEFEILIEIQNTAKSPQRVLEIGLEDSYLSAVQIRGVDPPFTKKRLEPLASSWFYEFDHELPGNSKTTMRFRAAARVPGEHKGLLSICINSSISCLAYDMQLTVTPKK